MSQTGQLPSKCPKRNLLHPNFKDRTKFIQMSQLAKISSECPKRDKLYPGQILSGHFCTNGFKTDF